MTDHGEAALTGEYTATNKSDDDPDRLSATEDRDPIACCRYCQETFLREVDAVDHTYSCEAFAEYRADDEAEDTDPEDDLASEFADRTYFIDPQPHEFKAYVKYDTGLTTYYGLNSLQKEHDFEDHGALCAPLETDVFDDPFEVEFQFKTSGLAPRDDDSIRLEEVREYLVKVHPEHAESHDDATRKATFTVSPRWPDLESKGDGPDPSNPHDILGLDVTFDGANIAFADYPELFYDAMRALRDRQGFRFRSPTTIPVDDVHPSKVHHSSNVIDAELYVRVAEGETGRVYAFDGTLHRLSTLLGDTRRGYAETVRNDLECSGYYHTTTLGSMRAEEFIGDHRLGKEVKHYHVNNPDAVDGDGMLEHPKVGVSFQHSVTDRTVYWDDLDRLERELDETLLNVLQFSDIPLRPDDQVYVADDEFSITGSRRHRKLLPDDYLPRVEQQQDVQVAAAVNGMYETDAALVDELLTDGGEISPQDLADRLDRCLDTIYRSLKRLGDAVIHEYGDVRLRSKHIAQQMVQRVEGLKQSFGEKVSDTIDDLVAARTLDADETTAFQAWLDTYGVDLVETPDGEPNQLDVGYSPEDPEEAKRILRSGANYWSDVAGRPSVEFAKRFEPELTLADGTSLAYQNWYRMFGGVFEAG